MKLPKALQEAGGSLDDFVSLARRAFYAAFNRDLPYERQGWVADVFEDHVIVSKGNKFFRVDMTVTDDEVTFADPPWPEVRLEYVPAASSTPADQPVAAAVNESVNLTIRLAEASKTTEGLYPGSVIVVEGLSANNNEYTAAALESGVKIFEGAKLVADHEIEEGANARPEGSIRDVIGKVTNVHLGERDGKQALLGDVFISESEPALRTKVKEGILGDLSIKAFGSGKRAEDGHFTVETFQPHPYTNVAMVTVAAAGGVIVSESVTTSPADEAEPADDDDAQPVQESGPAREVRLLQEAEDVTQLEEVTRERDHLLEENTRLFKELREGQALGALRRVLADSAKGLPKAAIERLQTQAKPLVEAFTTHGSEQTVEQFSDAVRTLVEAEKAYLAQIVPNGAVTGLTQPGESAPVDDILTEAFKDIVPPGQVAVAVRGRG